MTATSKQMMEDFEVGRATLLEIEIGDRRRQDYGDIDDLAKTIRENGLICPLAVRRMTDDPNAVVKYELAAGGRRYAACLKAGIGEVPIRIYPQDVDPHQMAIIEHIENLYRKDFTVEESLASVEAIHKAQIAIHGEKISSSPNEPGWTQQMTAEFIGMSRSAVNDMLSIAKAAKKHPEIAKARTMDDARKLKKAIEKNSAKSAHAQKISAEALAKDTNSEKARLCDSFIVSDCFAGMSALASQTFDIAEIDPPYAINYKDNKARGVTAGTTTLEYNEVDEDEYPNFMEHVIVETKRLLKPDGWLLLWHANNWELTLYRLLTAHGFSVRLLPAIWYKPETAGATMQPKRMLARNYEQFFYAALGNAEIHKQGRSDVFSFKGIPSTSRCHPTERPIELITEVLGTFAAPGSSVLVPFAGSGNTLLAANNLHMPAVGFDLSQLYKDTFTVKVYEGKLGEYRSHKA